MKNWRIKLLAWALYLQSLRMPYKWSVVISMVVFVEISRELCSGLTGSVTLYGYVMDAPWVIGSLLFIVQLAAWWLGFNDHKIKADQQ